MKRNQPLFLKKVTTGLFVIAAAVPCLAQRPYHLVKELPLGGEGGWDYLSVDDVGRRLYVSHATKVVVIDLENTSVLGEVDDTPGVHGVAIAADLGKGFVSNGRANNCSIIDLKTLQTLSKVPTGQNPDGMLYEPQTHNVYMFNGRSSSATVIDGKEGKVVATIPLEGKPEFPAADPKAGRVFDNLEDQSQVVAIDTRTYKVVNRWPLAPGEEPSGMAIDVAHQRLFIGCRNKLMVMMDNTSGKVVATVPIGSGVDACAFDSGTQLAFASCGDGTTTIAHEDTPDKLTVIQTLTTAPGARTMALDPKTHQIYLAAAKYEAGSGDKGGRRRILPGSFKILVYGMEQEK